jgi:hypothetical protein
MLAVLPEKCRMELFTPKGGHPYSDSQTTNPKEDVFLVFDRRKRR